MSDAIRDVLIRINVIPGDIQKIDLSKIVGQSAAIQETYAEQVKSYTTMAEQQKKLADAEGDRLTVAKEHASVAQQQIDYAKQMGDVNRLIRPLTEPGQSRTSRPLTEPGQPRPVSPVAPPESPAAPGEGLGPPDMAWFETWKQKIEEATKQYEEHLERRKQLLGQATEAAQRMAENDEEIRRQQMIIDMRQEENELIDQMAAAEARAAEQAQNRLPQLRRGLQQDITQTISGVVSLVGHLAMLESIGGDSVEEIARQFVKLQSSLQVINSTSSIFNNASEGLGRLTKMGDAVGEIVRQQQALGVATTFSQAATLRLAGAATTVNAVMGPIGLIATGITAAIVAADFAMTAFGETSEEAARINQEHLRNQNAILDETIAKLNQQTMMLNGQSEILQHQWDIRQMMAGGQLNPSQLKSQLQQQQELAESQSANNLRKTLTETFKVGMTDEIKIEQARLNDERKRLIEERNDLLRRDNNTGVFAVALGRNAQDLRALDEQQKSINQQTGFGTFEALRQTKFEDGTIVDFDKFMNKIDNLPLSMNEQAGKILSEAAKQLIEAQKATMSTQQTAMSQAAGLGGKVQQSQRDIDMLTQKQKAEEDLAARYGGANAKFAMTDVDSYLNQFSNSQDVDRRKELAEEAMKALDEAGLMTPDLRSKFRGSNTDPAVVRSQIQDDREYTEAERQEDDAVIANLTAAKVEADNQRAAFNRLAEELKNSAAENTRQLDELRRAIANRDAF